MDVDAIWERRDGEPRDAYELLRHYLHAGPTRSIRKTADATGTKYETVRRCYHEYTWLPRADAYDTEQDRLYRAKLVERRIDAIDYLDGLSRTALDIVLERLEMIRDDEKYMARMSVTELTKLYEVASKTYLNVLGEPTDRGRHEVTVTQAALFELPSEERNARITRLVDEAKRRGLLDAPEPTDYDGSRAVQGAFHLDGDASP